jgi:hypothetical protein
MRLEVIHSSLGFALAGVYLFLFGIPFKNQTFENQLQASRAAVIAALFGMVLAVIAVRRTESHRAAVLAVIVFNVLVLLAGLFIQP